MQYWGSVPEEKKTTILAVIQSLLNYLLAALFLTVPVSVVLSFFFELSLLKVFFIFLALFFFFPYMEHYYVWFREDWKREIK